MELTMSVTPAEILIMLKGEGSAELQARFLQEADDPQSDLVEMLKGVAIWARTCLNVNSPSVASSAQSEESSAPIPIYRVLRKAGFWDDHSRTVSAKDLVDYCRGTATAETVALVKKALEDPSSELSQILKSLE
jgi:hypothetical protein